jgi:hypothetical protein
MRTKFHLVCFALIGLSLTALRSQPAATNNLQLASVKKIWNQAQHSAFTDLIRFENQWFCTFRESEAHIGGNGKIRVLASRDGEQWDSAALLSEEGVDLRDPKLSVTPANRLMLVLGGSVYEGKTLKERQSRVAFSADGRKWSAPQRVLEKGDWLWRITWHKGRAYGIAYSSPVTAQPTNEWMAKFFVTEDGTNYRLVKQFDVPGRPNEATARFLDDDECIVLLRREAQDKFAWIGRSRPPYQDWKWQPAGLSVGGPNFITIPGGEMMVGGRQSNPAPVGPKTFVGRMDMQSVMPQLILPSGGDCSYPGLVWHEGQLWVSYYSSHEGKSSIYLAKVKVSRPGAN